MGIFSRQTKSENELREVNIMKELASSSDESSKNLYNKLNDMKYNPLLQVMKPYDLYFDVLEMIMANTKNFQKFSYFDTISVAERIYKHVFIYDEETPDFDDLYLVFIEFFDENSVVFKKCFNETFFNLFNNKHNYIKWIKSINQGGELLKIEKYYLPYAVTARSFFPDEDMFTANIIGVTNKLLDAVDQETVYSNELKKIEHMAGIYNVDESLIMNAEQHINMAEHLVEKSSNILAVADERVKTIDSVSKNAVDSVKHMCNSEVEMAKALLNDIDIKLNNAFREFVENQQQVILYDKQQLIKSVFAEAEQKLNEMKRTAQMTVNSANLELMRINQESGDVVSKIDAYVKNDENIKKIMENAASSEALMSKIDRLMIINDQNIDQISRNMSTNTTVISDANNNTMVAANSVPTNIVQPNVISNEADQLDEIEELVSVNPLLDENISFKERYERVMARKQEMIAQGEHFHEMFDDVVIAVMENSNPYLIGPSGCGKTYMVSQISRLLDLSFIDIGYINEEYDILGFQTANGGYSKPNFYRCYKYGKIAFCDELDNGNSRATVKLNSFLSNTEDASYNFPNGENVKRHPNFRMIGAGNTAGNGADNNYNTREKIEESVQQRFTPIYVDYDNSVEKVILGTYEDWYEFVVLFRAATDAFGKSNFGDAPGIITTRDVTRIKKYLDHESFSMEKILEYEFIQTKDSGYLAFLSSHMNEHAGEGNKAAEILRIFTEKVDKIRNTGAR